MATDLNERELPSSGTAIRMMSCDIPDYIQQAIKESFERGRRDALLRRLAAKSPETTK